MAASRVATGAGFRGLAAAAALALLPCASAPAGAQTPGSAAASAVRSGGQRVAYAGSMGSRALLVIDGGAPRAVAVGSTVAGVKLLSVDGNQAVVEIDGTRWPLRLGASALNYGGTPSAGNGLLITLSSSAGGHFMATGQVNGRSASFLVDTGATLVSIGQPDAERLGLSYQGGTRVTTRTANGESFGWLVTLDSLRVGDVDVFNVPAIVQPQAMPFILLGNSYLTRFQMRRDNDTLTLVRRF